MIDRSNAVNLARNLREYLVTPTLEGVRCLVDAVLAMDEYIRSHEAGRVDIFVKPGEYTDLSKPENREALMAEAKAAWASQSEADQQAQRDATLEEAAKLFDGYTYGVYAHPAKIIRALKRQSATEGKE